MQVKTFWQTKQASGIYIVNTLGAIATIKRLRRNHWVMVVDTDTLKAEPFVASRFVDLRNYFITEFAK